MKPENPNWLTRVQKVASGKTTSLNLSSMGFTELPDALRELPGLEYLHLTGNRLTTLPGWFEELKNLKELFLSDNHLAELPRVIGQLPNLEKLKKLERMDISNNPVQNLEATLKKMKAPPVVS